MTNTLAIGQPRSLQRGYLKQQFWNDDGEDIEEDDEEEDDNEDVGNEVEDCCVDEMLDERLNGPGITLLSHWLKVNGEQ